MTPTSVGMRCPECSRERTKVKTIGSVSGVPQVTQALILLNVIAFVAETAAGASLGGGGGGWVWNHGVLFGPSITSHTMFPPGFPYAGHDQYWRLVTAGFLHDGIFHILVNMVSLYFVGRSLEPGIGRLNFGVIYAVSLFAGSFGALLLTLTAPQSAPRGRSSGSSVH